MLLKQISVSVVTLIMASACANTPIASSADPNQAVLNTTQTPPNETFQNMKILTPERLTASPSLSGPSPRAVKYSPDGKLLTFLKAREDDAQRLDLWAFDVVTGEASMLVDSKLLEPDDFELSEEEKALRERKRIAGSKGIVSYDWDTKGEKILVPLGGDLYLVSLNDGEPVVTQLTDSADFEYNAEVSPNGNYVSFIRNGELYAIDLTTNTETRLSPAAEREKAISYGVSEFVAQEEMSRYVGAWWSPGDAYMAYTRVDESPVAIIPRFDIQAKDVTVINQRYPRTGEPNAIVDVFVKNLKTGKDVQVKLDASPDTYLARVNWLDKDTLFIQRVNREQTQIELLHVNLNTGEVMPAYVETQPYWINLSHDFRALSDGHFLWSTEETGFRHITLHDKTGKKLRQITSGDWAISGIAGVDEDAKKVYFTGYKDTPLEHHLYVVSYAADSDGEITRITDAGGLWSINMNGAANSYVGTFQSPDTPSRTGLYKADGSLITWVEENKLDEKHPYFPYLDAHVTPEYGTLTAEDGQTLYYSILKPHDFDPSKKYPAIVEVYGGPHAQLVTKSFRLADTMTAQRGYVVFRLDNRGSGNRGKKFEDVIYRNAGDAEVKDQLQGVDFLKSLPYIDGSRIGINGWSYGGYMALMTTLKAPEGTFAASVSGAPVTDWSLYDTFYTERYMDTPQTNPEGYEASSVFPYLKNLSSPLLMFHGMADDNVTFDNSTRVFAELQKMNKPFEMMTYPGERHGVRDKDKSAHVMNTRLNFLDRYLKPGE